MWMRVSVKLDDGAAAHHTDDAGHEGGDVAVERPVRGRFLRLRVESEGGAAVQHAGEDGMAERALT